MNRFKAFLNAVRRSKSLKYGIVLVAGVLIVGFLDENSVWSHFRNKQRISELEGEISVYLKRYERDKEQLRRLDSDPKAIEKIARERYFMKADNEDIFVLSDDMQSAEQTYDETTE